MAPIIKQTITQKQLTFWRILSIIILVLIAVNMIMNLLAKINPVLGTLGGLLSFIGLTGTCFFIIYKRLAYYNYRIIEDELIMERVFGRANHLFLNLKIPDLEFFIPYSDFERIQDKSTPHTRVYKFVSSTNKELWYVGEFWRSSDHYRFIIEPNEEVRNAISLLILNK